MKHLHVNTKVLTFILFFLILLPSCNNEEIFIVEESAIIADETLPTEEDTPNNEDTAPPIDAVDDTVSTMQNVPVDIEAYLNDINLPESITVSNTNPSNGVLTINDNDTPGNLLDDTIVYTPNTGFSGVDSFEYTICDATNAENCDTATVTITIEPIEEDIATELKAFPTAIGAGAYATGGRGGQVIHVTTLVWDAPGGLKEAIETQGARTIVFDVSGVINVTSYSFGDNTAYDNVTFAGQTSPGGITILHGKFIIKLNNVIMRYITFMVIESPIAPNLQPDALAMYGASNLMIDHCNFYYGADEGVDLTNSGAGLSTNITFQRNIIGKCKTGMLIGSGKEYNGVDNGGDSNCTVVNNLFTSTSHRFPNPKEDFQGQMDIINNVVYNYRYRLVRNAGFDNYSAYGTIGTQDINYIGNYNKTGYTNMGDSNKNKQTLYDWNEGFVKIYTASNIVTGYQDTPVVNDENLWNEFVGSGSNALTLPSAYFTQTQHTLLGRSFPVLSAADAYTDVMTDVGMNKYLNADGTISATNHPNTELMMDEAINNTATTWGGRSDMVYPTISSISRPAGYDTDADGMPNIWETSMGFNPDVKDDSLDYDNDGYTNIEEYLNMIDK